MDQPRPSSIEVARVIVVVVLALAAIGAGVYALCQRQGKASSSRSSSTSSPTTIAPPACPTGRCSSCGSPSARRLTPPLRRAMIMLIDPTGWAHQRQLARAVGDELMKAIVARSARCCAPRTSSSAPPAPSSRCCARRC